MLQHATSRPKDQRRMHKIIKWRNLQNRQYESKKVNNNARKHSLCLENGR